MWAIWAACDSSARWLSTHLCSVLPACVLLRFFQQLLHNYKKPPPWRGSGWPVHRCYFGKPWKQRWALSCCTDGSLKKFPFCMPGFSWAARGGSRCFIWSVRLGRERQISIRFWLKGFRCIKCQVGFIILITSSFLILIQTLQVFCCISFTYSFVQLHVLKNTTFNIWELWRLLLKREKGFG